MDYFMDARTRHVHVRSTGHFHRQECAQYHPSLKLEVSYNSSVFVTVAALYRGHRWLIRGLVAAFLCEITWLICVWTLLFPRSAPLDSGCDVADLGSVKWCFLAVAYAFFSWVLPSPLGC
jgi:hypothetical protein